MTHSLSAEAHWLCCLAVGDQRTHLEVPDSAGTPVRLPNGDITDRMSMADRRQTDIGCRPGKQFRRGAPAQILLRGNRTWYNERTCVMPARQRLDR
ncbi:hypothetical protein [Paraburkholderia sp. J11-2]|uniref:hypothetical protein n=1 Tax=Paraburkholderia sp. J11-2 TaxID=2805431 RepID=UPI002AB7EB1D|nr:hypothetical protein [Paraburkholderia sp. J11-2]